MHADPFQPPADFQTRDSYATPPSSSDEPRSFDGDDLWWSIAARQSRAPSAAVAEREAPSMPEREAPRAAKGEAANGGFFPLEPRSLEETGLTDREIESLILKYLLNCGSAAGRAIANQLKLPFRALEGLLARLKAEQLIVYCGSAALNDYHYQLTDFGTERARRYAQQCSYFGAAPVPLADYVRSVPAQSIRNFKPKMEDLKRALGDLLIREETLGQFGQALASGRGIFLYGPPGNGKTSIAERLILAYHDSIWIPRAISVSGHTIRLFDPNCHIPVAAPEGSSALMRSPHDARWIRIRRPTVLAGGELTLDSFDVSTNPTTGISEAPLQLKSNCGTFVIDDFGRQRTSPQELVNRWILPLERGYDLLDLTNGRKLKVPCDHVVVVSTNLAPRDVIDEAFLRRMPYKLELGNPSEDEFRKLFERNAGSQGIEFHDEPVEHLLATHYRPHQRPLRYCHPRDLIEQVANFCTFYDRPRVLTNESLDAAAKTYFAEI